MFAVSDSVVVQTMHVPSSSSATLLKLIARGFVQPFSLHPLTQQQRIAMHIERNRPGAEYVLMNLPGCQNFSIKNKATGKLNENFEISVSRFELEVVVVEDGKGNISNTLSVVITFSSCLDVIK